MYSNEHKALHLGIQGSRGDISFFLSLHQMNIILNAKARNTCVYFTQAKGVIYSVLSACIFGIKCKQVRLDLLCFLEFYNYLSRGLKLLSIEICVIKSGN